LEEVPPTVEEVVVEEPPGIQAPELRAYNEEARPTHFCMVILASKLYSLQESC
jgi:hypothetical protein